MPLVTNYGTLKAQVAATLHRADLAGEMDNAALMAASEISSLGENWLLVNFVVIGDADRYVIGGPEYGVPEEFIGVLEIFSGPVVDNLGNINGTDVIGFQSMNKTALWNELRKNTNAIDADHYLITPDMATLRFSSVPDIGTDFVMYYRIKLVKLVTDADTNFVMTEAPQLYIYAMCKHLSIFIQDIELATMYNDLFTAAIAALKAENDRGIDKGPIQIEGASSWG